MHFAHRQINLNIAQPAASGTSQPVMVPDGASKLTIQFFHSLSNPGANAATISLEQSTDGRHFDPCTDASGNPIAISLQSDALSATINLLGLLTLWVRFRYEIHADTTGRLASCNMLFS